MMLFHHGPPTGQARAPLAMILIGNRILMGADRLVPVLQMSKPLIVEDVVDPPRSQFQIHAWSPEHHLATWLELQNLAFDRKRKWNEADFRREVRDRRWYPQSQTLAAYSPAATSIVGCVTVELPVEESESVARIHWLAVLPSYQRQQVGTALIQSCEELSRNEGLARIELETLGTSEAAIGFYRSLGFDAIH